MSCRTCGGARRPGCDSHCATESSTLLAVTGLLKTYPRKSDATLTGRMASVLGRAKPDMFHAVDGISLTIAAGESVGLVGESG